MTMHAIFEDYSYYGGIEGSSIAHIIIFVYIASIFTLVFYSLNFNQQHKSALPKFYFITSILGLYMLISFAIVIYACYSILS